LFVCRSRRMDRTIGGAVGRAALHLLWVRRAAELRPSNFRQSAASLPLPPYRP